MQYGGREQRKFVFEKVAAMSTWRGRRREELPLATQASRTEQAALVVFSNQVRLVLSQRSKREVGLLKLVV